MIVVPPPYSSICIEGGVFGVPPSTALGGTGGAPPTPPTLMRNQRTPPPAERSRAATLCPGLGPGGALDPRASVQGGPWILADRSGTGPGPVGDRS